MRWLLTLHAWIGAVCGLTLSIFGLSGALLVWKNHWLRWTLTTPTEPQVLGTEALTRIVERAIQQSDRQADYIVFSSIDLSANRVSMGPESGFYSDHQGNIITSWTSRLERPELWLFDLHHDLLFGPVGTYVGGLLALSGLLLTSSGFILWWRTRRQFTWVLWPRSFSRRDLTKHHRDLGALFSPLIFIIMLTGLMMAWRPMSFWLLSPFSSIAEMQTAVAPPLVAGGGYHHIDWVTIINRAQQAFPTASLRFVSLPKHTGDLIKIRLKQPEELTPNGQTQLWFDPLTGELVESRSATEVPLGLRVNSFVYPVHAAKLNSTTYQVFISLTGVVVALLGSLVVWRFWFYRTGR